MFTQTARGESILPVICQMAAWGFTLAESEANK